MMRFTRLIDEARQEVEELLPWDLAEELDSESPPLLVDVREPYEFAAMHIAGSINVPRGILETACEWDYEETVPELVKARELPLVLICRSGNRTILAAQTLQRMGYARVRSLKTGLRGWNDYEQPLVNAAGEPVRLDAADDYFLPQVTPEQRRPTPA